MSIWDRIPLEMSISAQDATNSQARGVAADSSEHAPGKVWFRRFQPKDEPAVREICYETGFQGKSAGLWLDANRLLFTDLWLLYYFRKTPRQVYVAVQDGRIVGYLVGCLNVPARNRYYRVVFPFVMLAGFCSGKYKMGRRTLRVLLRHIRDGLVHGFPHARSEKPCAEFHCNMRESLCGRKERHGLLLTQVFLGEMKRAGMSCLRASAVVRQKEVEGRYRRAAKDYKTRPTSIYADIDPGKFVLVDVYSDFTSPSLPAWWKKFWAQAQPLEEALERGK